MKVSTVDEFEWNFFDPKKVKKTLKMMSRDEREELFLKLRDIEEEERTPAFLDGLEAGIDETKGFFGQFIQGLKHERKEFGKVARKELSGWGDAIFKELLP